MTEVDQLNKRLNDAYEAFHTLRNEIGQLGAEATKTRLRLDLERAKRRLKMKTNPVEGKWTVAMQDAQIMDDCYQWVAEARGAESKLQVCQTELRILEGELSCTQSQARLIQTEAQATRYQT